ncbi:MAG: exo-beta-N-acetylmuramidase NamZ family protein [Bacteroidales bacterium]
MNKIISIFTCIILLFPTFGQLINGDARLDVYLPLLKNKRIGLVCNHTSIVNTTHLADTLLNYGVNLTIIMTPEHGLKGTVKEGELIDGITYYNQIPVYSLYGNQKKPTIQMMNNVDIILFDLQDVGCRFYTYISTLEYVMQATLEYGKQIIVLDRPNPNNYVSGPVLEKKYKSFVGMQSIPVCYGLTIGEYAMMINQEHWLDSNRVCNLIVIEMINYNRDSIYTLTIPPSPNLRSKQAIKNYPSLCFFEGTPVSVGRGTSTPFEIIGFYDDKKEIIYPKSIKIDSKQLKIEYLIDYYNYYKTTYGKEKAEREFFNKMFVLLSGTDKLKNDIINGKSAKKIRKSWQKDLKKYETIRKKYVIYQR